MHEACHLVYGMLFPETYLGVQRRRVYYSLRSTSQTGTSDWEEWRTNMLTSAILMPRNLILQYMQEYELGQKMFMVNRLFASKQYDAFSHVANKMGVSKMALAIRMKQLGLLERNDLVDPYSLVDICCDE